jgi:hypothetical protein
MCEDPRLQAGANISVPLSHGAAPADLRVAAGMMGTTGSPFLRDNRGFFRPTGR